MLRFLTICILSGYFLLLAYGAVEAQQETPDPKITAPLAASTATPIAALEPQIISPRPGQALQGTVPILVTTPAQNFQSLGLTFAYANDPTATWFLIVQGIQPVINQTLTQWDTSAITDGDYDLRLQVTLADGSQRTTIVKGVRVRNYSPIETETPAPQPPTSTIAPAETSIPTIIPTSSPTAPASTPTPPPANPAILNEREVWINAGKGAVLVIGLFALGGLYQAAHTRRRRR